MKRSLLFLLLAGLLASLPARAPAGVKVWHQHRADSFEKARFHRAVVSSEGSLTLARRLGPLAPLEASHVWDVLEDAAGGLHAATGPEGRIYRIGPDGKAAVLHDAEDSQVLCLARAADGALLAGTGPSGRVLRIDPKGQARVLCETGESYVWSLAVDPDAGTVYAATGPHGKIFRITPEGKAAVLYTTRQEHVLCVAVRQGQVYAGTDGRGLVYRIDPAGKGFVLFQAAQPEVRRLLLTPDAIYAATASPDGKGSGGAVASSGSLRTAALTRPQPDRAATPTKEPVASDDGDSKSSDDGPGAKKGTSAAAPSAPSTGENSVYRIAADGTAREVFRTKGIILSLLKHEGRLLVGTGTDGRLFEVDEATRTWAELARLDHGQVLCLTRRGDGSVVLGVGDPGELYVLRPGHAPHGTITSGVLDAKMISRWGALSWVAEAPPGARVTLAVRSGNVSEPDDTWSAWSAEQEDAGRAVIAAPAGRFLQYRVTLHASQEGAASPRVRGVTLRYANANQAPEVTKVEVPDLNAVDLDSPKKLELKWTVTDPNEDDLVFDLFVRKEGWQRWVRLEEGFDKTKYTWDTTTMPSGVYQLRVVASDRLANAETEALTAERVSEPFVVSHTPPEVSLEVAGVDGGRAAIRATARSPHVRLVEASFAINAGKWTPVFPEDGLFDTPGEKLGFRTDVLKSGEYVLVLRVRDAAGNLGSADVVFSVPAK